MAFLCASILCLIQVSFFNSKLKRMVKKFQWASRGAWSYWYILLWVARVHKTAPIFTTVLFIEAEIELWKVHLLPGGK